MRFFSVRNAALCGMIGYIISILQYGLPLLGVPVTFGMLGYVFSIAIYLLLSAFFYGYGVRNMPDPMLRYPAIGCIVLPLAVTVLSYIVPATNFFAALLRLLLMLNSLAQLFFYYGVAAHSAGVTRQWANLVIGIILISALLSWFVTDATLSLVLAFGQIGAQAILCWHIMGDQPRFSR